MRCDRVLKRRIRDNLARFAAVHGIHGAQVDDAHRAAVAVTVVDAGHGPRVGGLPEHETWQDDGALLLTRRSAQLRKHPGQWAFPGGRLDPGETPEQTARREMREEVAVDVAADAVLGRLDDFVTRSGFVITPVVVWGGSDLALQPNPAEVASAHRIPLAEFMRRDAPILESVDTSPHPVLRMPVGDDWIAAPTAAVIYQFREVCLLGKATRVAHYEQPTFAWS